MSAGWPPQPSCCVETALIDIPEVLINKRIHTFLALMFFLGGFLKDFWGSAEKGCQCCVILFFFSLNIFGRDMKHSQTTLKPETFIYFYFVLCQSQ